MKRHLSHILLTLITIPTINSCQQPEQLEDRAIQNEQHVKTEQYISNNLVTNLPRHIPVFIGTTFPAAYVTALDMALSQYNTLNLSLTFSRVTSSVGASIVITRMTTGTGVAISGSPTNGNPYGSILLNGTLITQGYSTNSISTVLMHHLGHCIGVRDVHVGDPQCPLPPSNPPGVILIPGTPSSDPNSVMRPCDDGIYRPFSQYDIITLNYFY